MRTIATLCSLLGVLLILGFPLLAFALDLGTTQKLAVLAAAFACFSYRLGLIRMSGSWAQAPAPSRSAFCLLDSAGVWSSACAA